MSRSAARIALGVAMILHGAAHAVLPLRGLGLVGSPVSAWISTAVYAFALLGFIAAGLALLGAKPFTGLPAWFAVLPASASLTGVLLLGDADLWSGVLISALLALMGTRVEVVTTTQPRRRLRARVLSGAATALFIYAAASTLTWSWHRTWGVTRAEWSAPLPGDRSPRDPRLEIMHAVTIDAPPDAVWPWLAQLGQDRAGFYSYDWLERAFFVDIHNTLTLRPEWQQRQVGDFVRATQPKYVGGLLGPNLGWTIDVFDPPHALVLRGWGAFVLQPAGDGRTRFIIRSTMSSRDIPAWAAAITFVAFELPHFLMERRMMLTIKRLAEHPPLES